MSDIEKLFLAAYPLWPKVLLQKFSSLLSFELAKFNPEINKSIIDLYNSLFSDKVFELNSSAENSLLLSNIQNGSKISKIYFDFLKRSYTALPRDADLVNVSDEFMGLYPYQNLKYYGFISFDTRLIESVSYAIKVIYEKTDFSFSHGFGTLYIVIPKVFLSAYLVSKKYYGAQSALAMIENGVSVDVDKKLLSEFVTFLNAYNKYGGELAAANSLQAEKNRQTMTDYKNSISEKLNSRKNELNDLRTQISFAAKNETASAKRDMQSLTLSAQSLMFQLQDKLK